MNVSKSTLGQSSMYIAHLDLLHPNLRESVLKICIVLYYDKQLSVLQLLIGLLLSYDFIVPGVRIDSIVI